MTSDSAHIGGGRYYFAGGPAGCISRSQRNSWTAGSYRGMGRGQVQLPAVPTMKIFTLRTGPVSEDGIWNVVKPCVGTGHGDEDAEIDEQSIAEAHGSSGRVRYLPPGSTRSETTRLTSLFSTTKAGCNLTKCQVDLPALHAKPVARLAPNNLRSNSVNCWFGRSVRRKNSPVRAGYFRLASDLGGTTGLGFSGLIPSDLAAAGSLDRSNFSIRESCCSAARAVYRASISK